MQHLKRRFLRWLDELPRWHTVTLVLVAVAMFLAGIFTDLAYEYISRAWHSAQSGTLNLLQNPGFEADGWSRETLYWTDQGGPFNTEFGEIFTPIGWTTWWFQDSLCSGNPAYDNGRPEVKIIGQIPDSTRVLSGAKATQQFTFWRCHRMGLLQQVEAIPGARYDLNAYGHSWYSQCSTKPHDPPLEPDCQSPIHWAHDWLSVGIDPTGGLDPESDDVIWSQAAEIYGAYGAELTLLGVQAQADTITVWLKAEATQPLKHGDVYWDSIGLQRVERVYLPLVTVGTEGNSHSDDGSNKERQMNAHLTSPEERK